MATTKHQNPNQNCLVGMACPNCGQFGPFKMCITESGVAVVSDDGTEPFLCGAHTSWADDAFCACMNCGHEGVVSEFRGESKAVFDQFQQVVIDTYDSGFHCCAGPGDKSQCGDGLLQFLLTELSEAEDCESHECAVQRLDTAIRQLTDLRGAFEAKLTV